MNQPPKQSDKFKEAAREAECDESEASFEDKLRRIAKVKPLPINDKAPE